MSNDLLFGTPPELKQHRCVCMHTHTLNLSSKHKDLPKSANANLSLEQWSQTGGLEELCFCANPPVRDNTSAGWRAICHSRTRSIETQVKQYIRPYLQTTHTNPHEHSLFLFRDNEGRVVAHTERAHSYENNAGDLSRTRFVLLQVKLTQSKRDPIKSRYDFLHLPAWWKMPTRVSYGSWGAHQCAPWHHWWCNKA